MYLDGAYEYGTRRLLSGWQEVCQLWTASPEDEVAVEKEYGKDSDTAKAVAKIVGDGQWVAVLVIDRAARETASILTDLPWCDLVTVQKGEEANG